MTRRGASFSPVARGSNTSAPRSAQFAGEGRARVDGLGDRNRSLSPETDNIWDTLMAHITPDPYPSSGSSFASVSVSASASASTTATTTAETDPHHGRMMFAGALDDLQCDPSDPEGNDDAYGGTRTNVGPGVSGRRAAIARHPPRSYARITSGLFEDLDAALDDAGAVAADSGSGAENGIVRGNGGSGTNSNEWSGDETIGGLASMQRIVRNLAQRQEIPDEWWAEAGLSRRLTRDISGN